MTGSFLKKKNGLCTFCIPKLEVLNEHDYIPFSVTVGALKNSILDPFTGSPSLSCRDVSFLICVMGFRSPKAPSKPHANF